jgi:hypothetical protein
MVLLFVGGELKTEEDEEGDEQSSGSERLRLRVILILVRGW